MTAQATVNGSASRARDDLLGARAREEYNQDEQRFSVFVERRLHELLQGERNDLLLLRVYPGAPERLGVMATTRRIDRAALRVPVVRRILEDTLLFLYAESAAGPAAQQVEPDGRLIERRQYPTKYPHIIIARADHYAPDGDCLQITWCARRVQNQRAQTQINRLLDVANLGFEVVGSLLK